MNIETELTPNPETLKFVLNKTILETGSLEFKNFKEAKQLDFANEIFQLNGIKNVFISSNFISITKESNKDWSILKPKILTFLIDYTSANKEIIKEIKVKDTNKKSKTTDKTSSKIEEVINLKVRPAVAKDGGDIIFERFEKGIVYLSLQGACVGCPSSTATLKQGIENLLKHYFPEVKRVEAVN